MLITVMIAPAVLMSAAGLLILGAGNRYGRIIDRIRVMNRTLLDSPEDPSHFRSLRDLLVLRAKRAWLAMALLHGAVLCFVLESLLLGASAAFSWATGGFSDAIIIVGMLLFAGASLALASEASVTFETTRRENEYTDRITEKRSHL